MEEGIPDKLYKAIALEQQGQVDDALDELFDWVGDLVEAGDFGPINRMLETLEVRQHRTDWLIGILTATLASANRFLYGVVPALPARPAFFSAVEAIARERSEWTPTLLRGLEH